MKNSSGMAMLACVIAVSSFAADDHQPQPRPPVQEHSPAILQKGSGDDPRSSGIAGDELKTVSREGIEYLERLRKGTPFGTVDFNLSALRAGMGARNEPRIDGVKLIRVTIGEIPCEWVLAPGERYTLLELSQHC